MATLSPEQAALLKKTYATADDLKASANFKKMTAPAQQIALGAYNTNIPGQTQVPAGGKNIGGRIYDASGNYVGMANATTPTTTSSTVSPSVSTPTTTTPTTPTQVNQDTGIVQGVRLQTPTEKQTQMPDYQDTSSQRMNEILSNLNAYFASSPNMFLDEASFKKSFDVGTGARNAAQDALIMNRYRGKQSEIGTMNANITRYNELSSMSEQDLMGITDPNDTKLINQDHNLKAKYEAAKKNKEILEFVYGKDYSKEQEPRIDGLDGLPDNINAEISMAKLDYEGVKLKMDELKEQMDNTYDDLVSKTAGTGETDAYLRSKANKLNASLQKEYNNLVRQANTALNKYNSLVTESQAYIEEKQAKMKELGFMMELQNYETNEQKDERERNKFIRQQEYQYGNIYSSDPATRRKAIEKAVDRVLTEFEGIPMVRSREQMVADIQKMVDNGTELGEAITQNIRKPIMGKPEYNLWKKNKLGIDTTPIDIGGSYYTQNADGSLSLWKGYGTQGTVNGKSYNPVDPQAVINAVQDLSANPDYAVGKKLVRGECGEFVNDWLTNAVGLNTKIVTNTREEKKAIKNSDEAKSGNVAIITSKAHPTNGHVAIVMRDNGNGTVHVKESNRNRDKTIHERDIPKSDIYGYFDPTLGGSSSVSGGAIQKTEPLTDKQFTQSNQIINSFKSDPQVKAFEEAYSQGLSLLSSLNDKSGPGDVAAIFQFMKTLDPSSVVRESEFEVAAKSAGVAEYTKNTYNRIIKGKKLTPIQSEAFAKLAKQYIINKASIYDTKYNDGIRRLEQQGITTTVFPTSIADKMREYLGVGTSSTQSSPTTITKNYFTSYKSTTPTTYKTTTSTTTPSYFNYILGY